MNWNLSKNIRGVHISTDGTITGILKDDGSTARSYAVKAGMYYPYAFKRVTSCPANTIGLI